MTGAIANLLVNVIIITLLVVTIAYCWILNRRIKILQDSKGELAHLLKHFDESTQRASESIIALQSASKKIGETIQARVEKANFLLDDLSFMIEKATRISQQMEAGFAVSRAKSRVVADIQPPARVEGQEREEELTTVSSAPKKAHVTDSDLATPVRASAAGSSRETTLAALQAVIERAKRRSFEDVDDEQDIPPQPSARGRTKSERELLEMIRGGFKG